MLASDLQECGTPLEETLNLPDDSGSMTSSAVLPATREGRPPTGATARLVRLAGPVMLAIAAQSFGNLVFHAALGRTLTAPEYGALGSVLAAMTLVAVPLSALQTAAARMSAGSGVTGRTAQRALTRTVLMLLPIAALLLALAAPVAQFLHLGSTWDAALLAPAVLAAGLLATSRGLLLGSGRTGLVAATYLDSLVVRLVVGLGLAARLGVTGALIGTVVGEVAALLHAALRVWPGAPGQTLHMTTRDLVRTTAVVSGLFAFTTVDLFLARHHLPGTQSGSYVAAATIGKTILALPAAAMSVAYPRLVAAWPNPVERRAALRSALTVVGVPALAGGLLIALMPGIALGVLYGTAFPDAGALVRALSLIAGSSAVVSVLTHAAMARGSRMALLPWLGAALQVVAITIWHSSPMAIAAASAASLALSLLVLGATEVRRWRGSIH